VSEKYQEIKPWRGLKIFRKFVARARNSQLWVSVTVESHNVDTAIFSIFGKVTSIPEKLRFLTKVVWQ